MLDEVNPAAPAHRWRFSLATLLVAPLAVLVGFAAAPYFGTPGAIPVAFLLVFSTLFVLAANDVDGRVWWLGFTCALACHLGIVGPCDLFLVKLAWQLRYAAWGLGISWDMIELYSLPVLGTFHFLVAYTLGAFGGALAQRSFRRIIGRYAGAAGAPRGLGLVVPLVCLCSLLPLLFILTSSLPPISFTADRQELFSPWMGAVAAITAFISCLVASTLAVWRLAARWQIVCGLAIGILMCAVVNAVTFWRDGTLSMWLEWGAADVPFLLRCPEVFLAAVCLAVALFMTTATYAVWLAVEPETPS